MKHKGVIWTNHILERMRERNLSYDDVYWVFKKPDEFHFDDRNGSYKYYRYHKGMRLAVVAVKNENNQWVMKTCWWKDVSGQKRMIRSNVTIFGAGNEISGWVK